MPERYDYDRSDYNAERGRSHERGFVDRATDEARSWFGDEGAQRRRQMDEQRDRERDREREWNRGGEWTGGSYEASRHSRYPAEASIRGREAFEPDRDWESRERSGSGYRPGTVRDATAGYSYRPAPYSTTRENVTSRASSSSWGTYGRAPNELYGYDRYRDDRDIPATRSSYWGRGPKGYQRSDARLHEEICDRLTYSEVDAENIEVSVVNGEVTLAGSVSDRWHKRKAEDLVEDVPGVRDVRNNMRVERDTRGAGMGVSPTSASNQPGSVLGVTPTPEANITNQPPAAARGRS